MCLCVCVFVCLCVRDVVFPYITPECHRVLNYSWFLCLKGYFTDGHDLLERIMDVSRRETERCDSPQGFQVRLLYNVYNTKYITEDGDNNKDNDHFNLFRS